MKPGDIVNLIAADAHKFDMTIESIDNGGVLCAYFTSDRQLHKESYSEEELTVITPTAFPVKVAPMVASKEVVKWLDYKKVRPVQRAVLGDKISTLIQAVMYGNLEIQPDFSIVHNLNFPVETTDKKIALDKLTYVPRISAEKIDAALASMTSNTEIANTLAYGAALSGQAYGLVAKVDSSDVVIMAAVGVFFT